MASGGSSLARIRIATALSLCVMAGLHAQDRRVQPIVARKQVALVIGNAAYGTRPLANSVNDAHAMARVLQSLNYDVALVTDADRKAMGQAIDKFVAKLGTGDVAFFYYSGHGLQVEGENYLIPVDFELKGESDVRYDAHPAGRIQDLMERSGAKLNIMVLDACRDNPFHSGSRASGGGLAAMSGGKGTFIAFATSPGKTASDNPGGKNGLFTQYLLEALPQPGLGLGEVFDVVRERVDAASKGKQLPWTLSSVVGRYSFIPGTATLAGNAPTVRPSPTPNVNTPDPRVGANPPSVPNTERTRVNEKDGLLYVWIPPGTFTMGCSQGDSECFENEKPAHLVTITKGFWMGQTPVTQEAYQRVMSGTNPSHFRGAKLPVETVNWNEAQSYCQVVGMRLPTEAEWEYATRAGGAESRYGDLNAIAWSEANSGKTTHEVGQKEGNAWGLYDVLGNVWQWTSDLWDPDRIPGASIDPTGPSSGKSRTVRGGSWYYNPRFARASARNGCVPDVPNYNVGFRCVGN
jgi:formylglycine-generating enzyme required for sulfatase activity